MMRNVNFIVNNIEPGKIAVALNKEVAKEKIPVFVEAILETSDAESVYKASLSKNLFVHGKKENPYITRFCKKLLELNDERYLCKFAIQFKLFLKRKQVEDIADKIIASKNGKCIAKFILNVSQNIRIKEMKEAVYKYCNAKQLLEIAKHVRGYDMDEVGRRIIEENNENLIKDYCDAMNLNENEFYNYYLNLYIEE